MKNARTDGSERELSVRAFPILYKIVLESREVKQPRFGTVLIEAVQRCG
jgi:hypothetical protein